MLPLLDPVRDVSGNLPMLTLVATLVDVALAAHQIVTLNRPVLLRRFKLFVCPDLHQENFPISSLPRSRKHAVTFLNWPRSPVGKSWLCVAAVNECNPITWSIEIHFHFWLLSLLPKAPDRLNWLGAATVYGPV